MTVQNGVPVGIMRVSGCTSLIGGASFVGLDSTRPVSPGASSTFPTFALLSKA